MIKTWPEIQKTAEYFTGLLVSEANSTTVQSSEPEASTNKFTLSTRPKDGVTRQRQIVLSATERTKFQRELERQLWLKFLKNDNWRPEMPEFGRAYRCISIRLLHKRAQLFDRLELFDRNTAIQQNSSNYSHTYILHSSNNVPASDSDDRRQFDAVVSPPSPNGNVLPSPTTCSSSLSTSRSSSIDSTDSFLLSTSSNWSSGTSSGSRKTGSHSDAYDLGTHVYIDPIIIRSIQNSIDPSIASMNKSRQYVEVLRYLDQYEIDGKYEMTLWIDPGLVEVQHIKLDPAVNTNGNNTTTSPVSKKTWSEDRRRALHTSRTSTDEIVQVENKIIYMKTQQQQESSSIPMTSSAINFFSALSYSSSSNSTCSKSTDELDTQVDYDPSIILSRRAIMKV